MVEKDEIRKKMLLIRRNILKKQELSKIICNKIIKLDIYQRSQVIALYKAMNDEVDIDYLIKYSLENKKTILLPRVCDDKLVFYKIDYNTKYVRSHFGVLEPIDDANIYLGPIDLIICPGVSFDIYNHRLGYGKGYYDRFLKDKNIYKIGVSFSEQIVPLLPSNNLDIKMDLVITDKS